MIYIDRVSTTPIYQQIYQQIQRNILEDKLNAGQILTGCRLLSREIGVGRNTIDNAYAQLAAEGYIEAKKGVGFVVLGLPKLKATRKVLTDHVRELEKNPRKKPKIRYDLSYGNFPSEHFPVAL